MKPQASMKPQVAHATGRTATAPARDVPVVDGSRVADDRGAPGRQGDT